MFKMAFFCQTSRFWDPLGSGPLYEGLRNNEYNKPLFIAGEEEIYISSGMSIGLIAMANAGFAVNVFLLKLLVESRVEL